MLAALRKKKKAEMQAQKEQEQARNLLGWQEQEAASKKAIKERQLERDRENLHDSCYYGRH